MPVENLNHDDHPRDSNMKIVRSICFFAVMLSFITPPASSHSDEPVKPFRVVAYVPNWINLNEYAKTIRYSDLTHINIAFENPVNDDGELSFHSQNESLIQAAHAKGVKVLVSIGGGSAVNDKVLAPRYRQLLSPGKRADFAARLVEYIQKHGFDGIDVDLEGPAIDDDYGPFIDELAKQLKPAGKLLTAALSQGYGGRNVPASALHQFDFVNIMAYDGAGPWGLDSPGQHSSLAFAKSNTQYWVKRGLEKSRAVLGVPFYGYGFGDDFTRSGISYKAILKRFPGSEKTDQVGSTIWFNGMPTIQAKTRYALDEKLGGIMIWSLNQDVDDERSLLGVIAKTAADNE